MVELLEDSGTSVWVLGELATSVQCKRQVPEVASAGLQVYVGKFGVGDIQSSGLSMRAAEVYIY